MTDSMVERVAAGIFASQPRMPNDNRAWKAAYSWEQCSCRNAARSALTELLNPTNDMIDAMITQQEAQDAGLKGSDRDVFIAAIAEALIPLDEMRRVASN